MKLLSTLTGGYKRVMDRLLTLQSETQIFINAQYASLGYDMVLQGCAVTDNGNGTVNIAAGIMLVNGNAIRFAGANNISSDGSQAIVANAAVTSTPSIFGDGSIKNLYSEVFAGVAAQDPTNASQIKIKTTLYTLQQYIKDQINASEPKGTIKHVYDLDGTFLANFNADGLGTSTTWINWALDNGNFTTPGSAGMVLVGAGTYTDPVSGLQTTYADQDTDGEREHTLTPSEIPPLLTANKFGATTGTALPSIVTLNNAAGTNSSIGVNPDGGDSHNNMQPYIVCYRVVKIV